MIKKKKTSFAQKKSKNITGKNKETLLKLYTLHECNITNWLKDSKVKEIRDILEKDESAMTNFIRNKTDKVKNKKNSTGSN
jgi:hypothetical protein